MNALSPLCACICSRYGLAIATVDVNNDGYVDDIQPTTEEVCGGAGGTWIGNILTTREETYTLPTEKCMIQHPDDDTVYINQATCEDWGMCCVDTNDDGQCDEPIPWMACIDSNSEWLPDITNEEDCCEDECGDGLNQWITNLMHRTENAVGCEFLDGGMFMQNSWFSESVTLEYIRDMNEHKANARLVLANETWYEINGYLSQNTNYIPPYHWKLYKNEGDCEDSDCISGTAAWDWYWDEAANNAVGATLCYEFNECGQLEHCDMGAGECTGPDYEMYCCGYDELWTEKPMIGIGLDNADYVAGDYLDIKVYADVSFALDMCGTNCMNRSVPETDCADPPYPHGGTGVGCIIGLGGTHFTTKYDYGNWIDWEDCSLLGLDEYDWWWGLDVDLDGETDFAYDPVDSNENGPPDRFLVAETFEIGTSFLDIDYYQCYVDLVNNKCLNINELWYYQHTVDRREFLMDNYFSGFDFDTGEGSMVGPKSFPNCAGLGEDVYNPPGGGFIGDLPSPDDLTGETEYKWKPFAHCDSSGVCKCGAIPLDQIQHGEVEGEKYVQEDGEYNHYAYACISSIPGLDSDNDLTNHFVNEFVIPDDHDCPDPFDVDNCDVGGGNFGVQCMLKPVCTTHEIFGDEMNNFIIGNAINYIPQPTEGDFLIACDDCCLFNSTENWMSYYEIGNTIWETSLDVFDLYDGGGWRLHYDIFDLYNEGGDFKGQEYYGIREKAWWGRYNTDFSNLCKCEDNPNHETQSECEYWGLTWKCKACSTTPDCTIFGDCCRDIISEGSACNSDGWNNYCDGVCSNDAEQMVADMMEQLCSSQQSQYELNMGEDTKFYQLAGYPCILNMINESRNPFERRRWNGVQAGGYGHDQYGEHPNRPYGAFFCDTKLYYQYNSGSDSDHNPKNESGTTFGYYDCSGKCFNPNNCYEAYEGNLWPYSIPCNNSTVCENNKNCHGYDPIDLTCGRDFVHFNKDISGGGGIGEEDWSVEKMDFVETNFWRTDAGGGYEVWELFADLSAEPKENIADSFTCCGGFRGAHILCANYMFDSGYHWPDIQIRCGNFNNLTNCATEAIGGCLDITALNCGSCVDTLGWPTDDPNYEASCLNDGSQTQGCFNLECNDCCPSAIFENNQCTDVGHENCYVCMHNDSSCEYSQGCASDDNPLGAFTNCCERDGICEYEGVEYDCQTLYADCYELRNIGDGECIPHDIMFNTAMLPDNQYCGDGSCINSYFNDDFSEGNGVCDNGEDYWYFALNYTHISELPPEFACAEWDYDLGDCLCVQCDCNGGFLIENVDSHTIEIADGYLCLDNSYEDMVWNGSDWESDCIQNPQNCEVDLGGPINHCLSFKSDYNWLDDYAWCVNTVGWGWQQNCKYPNYPTKCRADWPVDPSPQLTNCILNPNDTEDNDLLTLDNKCHDGEWWWLPNLLCWQLPNQEEVYQTPRYDSGLGGSGDPTSYSACCEIAGCQNCNQTGEWCPDESAVWCGHAIENGVCAGGTGNCQSHDDCKAIWGGHMSWFDSTYCTFEGGIWNEPSGPCMHPNYFCNDANECVPCGHSNVIPLEDEEFYSGSDCSDGGEGYNVCPTCDPCPCLNCYSHRASHPDEQPNWGGNFNGSYNTCCGGFHDGLSKFTILMGTQNGSFWGNNRYLDIGPNQDFDNDGDNDLVQFTYNSEDGATGDVKLGCYNATAAGSENGICIHFYAEEPTVLTTNHWFEIYDENGQILVDRDCVKSEIDIFGNFISCFNAARNGLTVGDGCDAFNEGSCDNATCLYYCDDGEMHCVDGEECYPEEGDCDGFNNCEDGSDEDGGINLLYDEEHCLDSDWGEYEGTCFPFENCHVHEIDDLGSPFCPRCCHQWCTGNDGDGDTWMGTGTCLHDIYNDCRCFPLDACEAGLTCMISNFTFGTWTCDDIVSGDDGGDCSEQLYECDSHDDCCSYNGSLEGGYCFDAGGYGLCWNTGMDCCTDLDAIDDECPFDCPSIDECDNTDINNCCGGYIPNCNQGGHLVACCPESWIGDTYCDNGEWPFVCDLTCYPGESEDCVEDILWCEDHFMCDNFNCFDCCPGEGSGDGDLHCDDGTQKCLWFEPAMMQVCQWADGAPNPQCANEADIDRQMCCDLERFPCEYCLRTEEYDGETGDPCCSHDDCSLGNFCDEENKCETCSGNNSKCCWSTLGEIYNENWFNDGFEYFGDTITTTDGDGLYFSRNFNTNDYRDGVCFGSREFIKPFGVWNECGPCPCSPSDNGTGTYCESEWNNCYMDTGCDNNGMKVYCDQTNDGWDDDCIFRSRINDNVGTCWGTWDTYWVSYDYWDPSGNSHYPSAWYDGNSETWVTWVDVLGLFWLLE